MEEVSVTLQDYARNAISSYHVNVGEYEAQIAVVVEAVMDGYELFLLPVLQELIEARMNGNNSKAGAAGGGGSADAEDVSMEAEST